ncbi:hypothetical protein JCM3774_006851 [Rhodotorula dairenensis]
MHFVTALTLVASASTLVSARLDQVRRHGDTAVAAAHIAARAPEPFRLFPAPGATDGSDHVFGHEGRIALRERDGSKPVSEQALEALLVSAHPLGHFADAPTLAKRSDTPKKASKCHKKKRPSSAKTADKSAGQVLAVSTEPKEATQRKTWADRQHDSASKKGANDDYKAKDSAAAEEPAKKKKAEDAFSSKESTQLAATPKSSDKGEDKKKDEEKKKSDSTPVFDGGAKHLTRDHMTQNKGLIGFTTDNCGPSGATEQDPNGSESFLSCGISKSNPSSPWQVPKGVTLDNIKTVSIEHALATNSVWEPCKPFIPLFEKYGAQTGLPPILLAALALQESTCNPHVLGDSGGAFGLMQITQDKCGGRDNHGCSEPDYNVRTGAEYFKKELDNAGGSFLEALARYNGWQPYSMTYSSATAAAYSDCCHCQNNLDYLYQMANGWLLGRTGYELGSFKNLAVCD